MDILWNIHACFITNIGMTSTMLEVFVFLLIVAMIYAFVFGMVYLLDSMINSAVVVIGKPETYTV